MIRARSALPRGAWSAPAFDIVSLESGDRHRRRVVMRCAGGLAFLLDLPEAVMLRDGDALALDDGRLVQVVAAPEPLAELRMDDARDLARLAWHLGNRHLSIQIVGDAIRLRRDPVIEQMARGLGAGVAWIDAPFDPERSSGGHAPERDDERG